MNNYQIPVNSRWRHKKTGGTYRITGQCLLEATRQPAILYQCEKSGTLWARDRVEFLDGRFEPVEDHSEG